MNYQNLRKTISNITLPFTLLIVLLFSGLTVTSSDKLENKTEYSLKTQELIANPGSCDFNCLSGIEETTDPDGTTRWQCQGFCTCEMIWTKPEDWGHGSCTNDDLQEN